MKNAFERGDSFPPPAKPEVYTPEQKESHQYVMATATVGKNGRAKNEDMAYIDPDRGIFLVADGVGGSTLGGTLASRAAVEAVLKSNINQDQDARLKHVLNGDGKGLEQTEVEQAIKELVTKRMRHRVERYRGNTNTTLTLGKAWEDRHGKQKITIAHTGDSRMYKYDGMALEKLTKDDSVIERIIDLEIPDTDGFPIADDADITRAISLETLEHYAKQDTLFHSMLHHAKTIEKEEKRPVKSLTLEEMRHFILHGVFNPGKNIIQTHDAKKGDAFLAMSDGIHDNLTDEEIQKIVERHYPDIDMIASALVEEAIRVSKDKNNPRYKPDDMTVSLMLQK